MLRAGPQREAAGVYQRVFPLLDYLFIDSQAALDALCQDYRHSEVLAIDTEFVRVRTLNPQLGLLQAYDGKQLALIDPLKVADLSPFWALLADENIVKVIHAGSEDLEIFRKQGEVVPSPLFDSQVAAAFVGMGSSLGYGKLIETVEGVTLDKGEARTDWLARPLRDAQLTYAANDVYYLHQAYFKLAELLDAQGKRRYCDQECRRLALKSNDKPAEARYLDVKNAWQLKPKQLAILKELAAWRWREANKRDLAVGFVIKDAALTAIAQAAPRAPHQLRALPELHPMEFKRHQQRILACVDAGLAAAEHPAAIRRMIDFPGYKPALKQLKGVIEIASREAEIPAELIASKKLIHKVLTWFWQYDENQRAELSPPELLDGWRNELVGDEIRRLMA